MQYVKFNWTKFRLKKVNLYPEYKSEFIQLQLVKNKTPIQWLRLLRLRRLCAGHTQNDHFYRHNIVNACRVFGSYIFCTVCQGRGWEYNPWGIGKFPCRKCGGYGRENDWFKETCATCKYWMRGKVLGNCLKNPVVTESGEFYYKKNKSTNWCEAHEKKL